MGRKSKFKQARRLARAIQSNAELHGEFADIAYQAPRSGRDRVRRLSPSSMRGQYKRLKHGL